MNSGTGKAQPDQSEGLHVHIRQRVPFGLDVTVNCAPGELLALVGPSGSGKTTVLRTIAGLHRAQAAHISCDGDIWDMPAPDTVHVKTQQRKVGLVFQDYALFPHKSVLDNVMLASPADDHVQRRKKAMAWLAKANMTGFEKRLPQTLSGGQRQRVALARALAREPTVLLLDEPFSAVDQQTRRKLYRELAALRESLALPIVLVTHDLTEVQLLADSLCLMHRGVSLAQGPVSEIINHPRSREIARLVGHQNLFNASIVSQQTDHSVYRLGDMEPIRGPRLRDAQAGDDASLLISPSAITLDKPQQNGSTSAVQNTSFFTLHGTVQESVMLGDELLLRLHLAQITKSLRFKLPLHEARARGIKSGSALSVYVQSHGLHGMAK